MRHLPAILLFAGMGLFLGGCGLLDDDGSGADGDRATPAASVSAEAPEPGTLADLLAFEADVLRRRAAWSAERLDAWSIAAAAGWTEEAEARFAAVVGASADELADWLGGEVRARRGVDVPDGASAYRDALLDWAAAVGVWSTRLAAGAVPDQPQDLALARARDAALQPSFAEGPDQAYLRATSGRLVEMAGRSSVSATGLPGPAQTAPDRRAWEGWTEAWVEAAEADLEAWDHLAPSFAWAELHRRWHDSLVAEVDVARTQLQQIRQGAAFWDSLSAPESWAVQAAAPSLLAARDVLRAEWLDRLRGELPSGSA